MRRPLPASPSCRQLGDFRVVQTINIIIVFLISGLVLRTEDIKKALSYWPGIVYGFIAILGITPCLGFALRELPLSPPEFAIGAGGHAAATCMSVSRAHGTEGITLEPVV